MEEKILKVGYRVKVNAKWCTKLVQGLVGGKTGTVEKVHHYPQLTYDVKFDEPYTFMGEEVSKGNYYQQELEIIEEETV